MRYMILPIGLFAFLFSAAQATYDARIVENVGMGYACEGFVKPVLKIINDGSETMSGCVVETWKNGLFANSFDWQLAVPSLQGEIRQPAFPEIDVEPGDIIEMRIISVNNVPDEQAEGNIEEFVIEADPPVAESYLVEVRAQAGTLPGAVSWSIQDRNAAVVFQSGSISLEANGSTSQWLELNAGSCYTLVAQDEGFDGGTVAVESLGSEVVVFTGGGTFPLERSGFTTGSVLSVEERASHDLLELFPTPTTGAFTIANELNARCTITVFDATGRVAHITTGQGRNILVDPGALSPGRYQVVLNDNAGATLHAPLVVVR